MIVRYLLCLLTCFITMQSSMGLFAEEPKGVPTLKIVYYTPSDCEPLPGRHERLGRVMKHIQEFYRKGMETNGYGPMTFALEWDEPGKLKLYDVKGKGKLFQYRDAPTEALLSEVMPALRSRGIVAENEFILVIGPFMHWKDDVVMEFGRYSGSGNGYHGAAWVSDDKFLDADHLSAKEPTYFYPGHGGPCSLGQLNTFLIGVMAHELGHCFGLSHDCELRSQIPKHGLSLMGSGNRVYGDELRNEGPGVFISKPSAKQL